MVKLNTYKHGLDVFSDCWLAYIMKYRSRLNVDTGYIAGFKGAYAQIPYRLHGFYNVNI